MILKRQEENKFTDSLIQETGITNTLKGKFFLCFYMLSCFLSALKKKEAHTEHDCERKGSSVQKICHAGKFSLFCP